MGTGKRKRTSRIWALLMTAVLVLASIAGVPGTYGANGGVNVKAAEVKSITLHFKLPDGTQASDWGFNCWPNPAAISPTADGVGEKKAVNGTWGANNMQPQLLTDETGWAKAIVNVSGDVGNIQFIKYVESGDTETAPTYYQCWNSGIVQHSDAYFNPSDSKWYTEKEFTTEITPPAPAVSSTNLTVHFKNSKNWAKVYSKFAAGGSWSSIEGLGYANDGFGAILKENEKNNGWYSFKIVKQDGETVNGLFNSGAWGDESQTDNFSIKIEQEVMEVWISFKANTGKAIDVSSTKPTGWVDGAAVSAPINPADLSSVESPVINDDGSVTFNYEISAAALGNSKLYLMGTLTDWSSGKEMTDPDGDGVYSITIPNVKPGRYQYKFKYGANTWVTDPMNDQSESGNSLLVVDGFLINCENPAGTGTFSIEAEVTENIKKDTIEWSIKGSPDGVTIAGNSTDKTKATLTTTESAATGYYTIVAGYTDDKGQKSVEKEVYYTKKAFLYEYTYKTGSTHKGKSDIYTWNNSKEGNVGAKFRSVGGKNTAYITVDDQTTDFGYIVRLDGMWGASESEDREFSDRSISVNTPDRYTKAKGGEGVEVPYLLPSAKSYLDGGIVFAWRDDDKFYNNAMDSMSLSQGVKVVVEDSAGNKTEYSMTYNSKDELFTYRLTGIETGTYKFHFLVGGVETPDQYCGGMIDYKKPELEVKATVTPTQVDYNQNPVVSFSIKDKDTGKDVEIRGIEADLTSLGYSGQKVNFRPSSKEGVLYIDSSVAEGTHTVPFTITDLWGNKKTVDVDINVVERTDTSAAWDESRIYFLLTDRFMNGDKSNDYNCAPNKIEAYHGGDFKGLTEKLGYLQELGINTIWITPIVDNVDVITNAELHQQGYHGYWAKDFTKIDEHLGNTADLDRLIDEAAKRDIKIMVDIVVNHAGYGTRDIFGNMLREGDGVAGNLILGALDGLPDFITEDINVRNKLIGWQTAWANHRTPGGNRIAYFRVDTVKHVDHETWQDLKTSLAKVNPAFKMIGEYFGAGVSNTGDYLGNGQMDALLDFEFKSTAKNFVNGNIDAVETSLETRNRALTNSRTYGQFLSSHDEDGFLYSLGGDTSKMKVAAALQMTAKGTPIIYYGEEINLTGPNEFGNQNNNRYNMQFDNLTEEQQAMLSHYRKLLAARTMYSQVFAKGNRTKVKSADGYLVFKRSYKGENVYVGLNTTNVAKTVTFSVSEEGLTNIYSGETVQVNSGSVSVTIPANSDGGTVILAKGSPLTSVTFQGPIKTSYYVGEDFNRDGITVTGIYENGAKIPITTGYAIDASAFDKTKTGTYTIKVSYGDYSQNYQVTVSTRPVPSSSDSSSGGGSEGAESDSDKTIIKTETTTDDAESDSDKTIITTETTTDDDGTVTKKVTEIKPDGSKKETITVTDVNGKVMLITERSTFTPEENVTAVVTVKKNGNGKVKKAVAAVTNNIDSGNEATLSGKVVQQLTEAAKQEDLTITMTVKDREGNTAYKLKANAEDLTAGNELYVYIYDKKNDEYIMVNAETYTVSGEGSITVSMTENKTYELVDKEAADEINKHILDTLKPKKSLKTIKKGKKAKMALSKEFNQANVKKITYKTSKKSVAVINSKGKIAAKKAGKVTIKAKVTLNNGQKKTVKMKVKVKK